MTLTTLSGTISHTSLNNNFQDKLDDIQAVNEISGKGKLNEYFCDVVNLTNTTIEGLRRITFVAPDDLEVISLKLVVQDASNGITVTGTLTAILPDDDTEVKKYLLLENPQVQGTTSGGTGVIVYKDLSAATPRIFLIKGVAYKLVLESNSATNLDRATCNIQYKLRRRTK